MCTTPEGDCCSLLRPLSKVTARHHILFGGSAFSQTGLVIHDTRVTSPPPPPLLLNTKAQSKQGKGHGIGHEDKVQANDKKGLGSGGGLAAMNGAVKTAVHDSCSKKEGRTQAALPKG
jgi:hypothetical protein